jgi:hypothetical protein
MTTIHAMLGVAQMFSSVIGDSTFLPSATFCMHASGCFFSWIVTGMQKSTLPR